VHIEPTTQHGSDVTTPESLGRFFDVAVHPVFHSVMRLTGGDRSLSEDLTQDAFRDLADAVATGRESVINVGWVVAVARRRYIDTVRRSARESSKLRLVASNDSAPEPTDWSSVGGDRVLETLARLPADQRVALIRRHVDGAAVATIASELGRSIEAIESLMARGRRTLRAAAARKDHE
jgi:RNA polymerase sigma-70 factor, ECF subfamily